MTKCSRKRCRQQGDYIAVQDREGKGTYHLCSRCWEAECKHEGSVQQSLKKSATLTRHDSIRRSN